MAHIELREIVKTYGDVSAVNGLSLRVEQGEFLALLGPSGCGKTTTLQMMAGFVEPSSGEIVVGSRSMTGVPSHKRNIGVMFQSYALFPHMSVFDNVAFGLKMRKVPVEQITQRVNRALGLVQLGGLGDRFPREMSGGQQQRVALARAIVIEPSVLLLDEPLSNLDASLREQMRFEIREIQKKVGITTVFVTHDQSEAMAVADRLVVMNKGEIRQVGTPQQIYETPADVFVAAFIGQANLLRGRVETISDGLAQLSLPALGEGQVVTARCGNALEVGRPVTLALRPEDLHLASEAPSGMNAVRGVVKRVNYLGSSINIGVQVHDVEMAVISSRQDQLVLAGEPVTLCWPKTAGILLVESA